MVCSIVLDYNFSVLESLYVTYRKLFCPWQDVVSPVLRTTNDVIDYILDTSFLPRGVLKIEITTLFDGRRHFQRAITWRQISFASLGCCVPYNSLTIPRTAFTALKQLKYSILVWPKWSGRKTEMIFNKEQKRQKEWKRNQIGSINHCT